MFDDYSSRRIDYQTFETNLCSQLTPALIEDLKFLGCRDDDQEEKIEERVKSETSLEQEGNNSGLKGDFGRIVERLLAPMRRDGIGFQEELEDLNLPDFGGQAVAV